MNSKKLSTEHQKLIEDVLDTVMNEYAADNKIIFASESERTKHHYGSINKRLKDWKKSRHCMVPGCSQQSISRSHTIPKGMSLTAISEKGHLLTPEFNQQTGALVLKPVGVSFASTFPAFCSVHEGLFEGFETQKKIETEAHVYLQLYRVACRELFRSHFLIAQHEQFMLSYCRLRDERLMGLVEQRALDRGFPLDTKSTSLSSAKDPLVKWANDRIAGAKELALHIDNKILPAIQRAIFEGCEDGIFVKVFSINFEIPVALSGCAAFYINDHRNKKQVFQIINVLPFDGHSMLILAGAVADKDYIQLYASKWMVNAFSMISMVESWMLNGTDQWYLKPSVWNVLPGSRKAAILDAILQCDQNIGEEYSLSIFDGIRTTFLLMLKEKEEPTQDNTYWRFVRSQKAKMI